ncbi:MAG TPA: ankyrin repeat domain-containing protein [Gallionella sp.]|nr:ankyrin repeat domain-containing protein [Gallionella sp.]
MDARLLEILGNNERNYPHALEQQYPRVFRKIMDQWDTPGIDACFADLMFSNRVGQQGFPPDVASDIIYLSMVHARQRDQHRQDEADPWGHESAAIKQEIELRDVPFTPEGFLKAAESGKQDVVALFLRAGVDVDTCDERQWTPLMTSSFNGDKEMALLLIQGGADVHHRDTAGYTPLHWAAFNGYSRVVQLLLNKHADVNARSNHGWTALLQAATRGHLSVTYILIEHGADVNAASNDGWTPLLKAAANGHFPEVKLLLRKGADASAKYSNGVTPLELAIKNKHEHVIAALSGMH